MLEPVGALEARVALEVRAALAVREGPVLALVPGRARGPEVRDPAARISVTSRRWRAT